MTDQRTNVHESLHPVLTNLEYVHIDLQKVQEVGEKLANVNMHHWLTTAPFDLPQLPETQRIGSLFFLDAISFSYWGEPKWEVEYNGSVYDGAYAMIASIGRALEKGTPLYDPNFIAHMRREDLETLLRGNVEIPLLDQRLHILHEIGQRTCVDYHADFRYVMEKAKGNAVTLVDLLATSFPCFEDAVQFHSHTVYFRKRAQLLAADIAHVFGLDSVENLTACADYKLPQVLRRYGILKYAPALEQKIRERKDILSRSREEVEIRATTIQAVELLKGVCNTHTSIQINDYLWLEGQRKLVTDEPYHRTRTTAY